MPRAQRRKFTVTHNRARITVNGKTFNFYNPTNAKPKLFHDSIVLINGLSGYTLFNPKLALEDVPPELIKLLEKMDFKKLQLAYKEKVTTERKGNKDFIGTQTASGENCILENESSFDSIAGDSYLPEHESSFDSIAGDSHLPEHESSFDLIAGDSALPEKESSFDLIAGNSALPENETPFDLIAGDSDLSGNESSFDSIDRFSIARFRGCCMNVLDFLMSG